MVGYKLVSLNKNTVVYNYYPENDLSNKGIISYDRNKGQMSVTNRAEEDEFSFYSAHMLRMLEESNETGGFQDNGYIAWY